ncbi:MAG: lactate utilization protein LutB domain-containing protein [Pirellulaceae bacterium]
MPFACSLCGSCTDVCPVKIPLHHQLLRFRRTLAETRKIPWTKRAGMKVMGWVFRRPWAYRWSGWLARRVMPWLPRFLVYNRLNPWGKQREMPEMPKRSFRELYQIERPK